MTDRFEPTADDVGDRVDAFLKRRLELSVRQVRRLIARGRVTHASGRSVAAGDTVQAQWSLVVAPEPQQQPPRIRVVARSDDFLVVDKPAGIVMHPLVAGESGTLLDAIAEHAPSARAAFGENALEGGLCHRLDTGTSGLVLCALNRSFYHHARNAFSTQQVEKAYVAHVHGIPASGLTVDVALRLSGPKVHVVAADTAGAYNATTRVEQVVAGEASALVRVKTHHGRRHQVRVHLAHAGHALVHDDRYAGADASGAFYLRASALRIDDNTFVAGLDEPGATIATSLHLGDAEVRALFAE